MSRQLLNRVRNNPKLKRNLYFGIIAGAVGGIVSLTTVLAVLALTVNASLADRMAEVAAVFGGAAVLLAFAAALVALRVYAVSTGKPDLEISVMIPAGMPANNPYFDVQEFVPRPNTQVLTSSRIFTVMPFASSMVEIRLRNESSYPASNPTVTIRLQAMVYKVDSLKTGANEWVPVEYKSRFWVTAAQWDGGPSYSVHGDLTRRLPDLNLDDLRILPDEGEPAIIIQTFADGYRKSQTLVVNWKEYEEQRSGWGEPRNPEWI